MVRLEPGMLIQTNYSGPYRIVEVRRNCTCPSYVDEVNMINPPEREPHIPLVFSGPDGKGIFYLNGFNEQMLLSLNKTFCGHKKDLIMTGLLFWRRIDRYKEYFFRPE